MKSPEEKKIAIGGAAKGDNDSNISTQRASQLVNKFTSQVSLKNAEEIKEDIPQIPNSPTSQDPLLQSEIVDLAPTIDLNATAAGASLNFMAAP